LTPKRIIIALPLSASLLLATSCIHVDPVEVKPIHIVMDINIRVDRELEQFFAFEDKASAAPTSAPATQPTVAAQSESGAQP
jgi:hypothetical protein